MQAVIFDCDGVLVDTEPLGRLALQQSLNFALSPDQLALLWPLGCPLEASLCKAAFGYPELMAKQMDPLKLAQTVRSKMADELRQRSFAIPGMPELVRRLETHLRRLFGGPRIAVCSNGPLEKMRLSLRASDFAPLQVDGGGHAVFSGHEMGCFKPDPQILLRAARFLGVSPASCLVVDDSAIGLEAALGAGMVPCAFGKQSHELVARHPGAFWAADAPALDLVLQSCLLLPARPD